MAVMQDGTSWQNFFCVLWSKVLYIVTTVVLLQAFFGILKTQPSLPDGTRELPTSAEMPPARAPRQFLHPGNGAMHASAPSTSSPCGPGFYIVAACHMECLQTAETKSRVEGVQVQRSYPTYPTTLPNESPAKWII